MAYFNTKKEIIKNPPIPPTPPYNPPIEPTPPPTEEGSVPSIPRVTFSGTTTVHFYKTLSEIEKVDKVLSNEVSCVISLKREVSVENPLLEINRISLEEDLTLYNYAYIESTARYYNAHITLGTGNVYYIDLDVDVLMSFKVGVRNIEAIIDKQQYTSEANMFVNDNSHVSEMTTWDEVKYFYENATEASSKQAPSFSFNANYGVLVCAGGNEDLVDQTEQEVN